MAVIKQRLQEKDGLRINIRSESIRIIFTFLFYYYGLTSHFFASQLFMLFSTNSSQIGQFSLFSLSHFPIFLYFLCDLEFRKQKLN